MKKSTLFTYLMWGYQANLDGADYDDLKNKLVQHGKELKTEDESVVAESLLQKFPQFQIMHQAFIRSRLDKISASISVIKVIAIIYLVAGIIGAIAMLSQID